MNEEQFFLANAYLDGELTAEERGFAEADPAVMAEVEQLRALQGHIRDVEPPSATARESAIGAAMAQFAPAAAAPAATPPRAPAPAAPARVYRRRPSYARYLAIAAAVVSVGLLGVVIARAPGGGDDDSAEPASEPASEADGTAFDRDATEMLAPAAEEPAADAATDAGADMAESAADDMAAEEPAEEPAADMAGEPAEEPASEPADAASADGDEPIALLPGTGLSVGMPIAGLDELALFGADLLAQRDEGLLPPTPNTACTTPGILSRAFYAFDDVVIEVEVAIDETGEVGMVSAIDPDTCNVLDQVALP